MYFHPKTLINYNNPPVPVVDLDPIGRVASHLFSPFRDATRPPRPTDDGSGSDEANRRASHTTGLELLAAGPRLSRRLKLKRLMR